MGLSKCLNGSKQTFNVYFLLLVFLRFDLLTAVLFRTTASIASLYDWEDAYGRFFDFERFLFLLADARIASLRLAGKLLSQSESNSHFPWVPVLAYLKEPLFLHGGKQMLAPEGQELFGAKEGILKN